MITSSPNLVCPRPKRAMLQMNCVLSALESSASKALSEEEARIAEIFGDDGNHADVLEFEGSVGSFHSLGTESPLRISPPQSPMNGSTPFDFDCFCEEDTSRSIALSPPLRAVNPVVSDSRFGSQLPQSQDNASSSKCTSSYEEQVHWARLSVTC